MTEIHQLIDNMIKKLENTLQEGNTIEHILDKHIELTIDELKKMKRYQYGGGWIPYYPKGWIDAGADNTALFKDISKILELWKDEGRMSQGK